MAVGRDFCAVFVVFQACAWTIGLLVRKLDCGKYNDCVEFDTFFTRSGDAVLGMVDKATLYHRAVFLKKNRQTPAAIIEALMAWVEIFGAPKALHDFFNTRRVSSPGN